MQYYTFLEFVEKVNVWIITNLEDGYRSRPLIDIMTISYCKDLSARLRGSDDEKCVFDIVINKSGNEIFFRVRDDGSGFFGERCFVMIHDSFSGWKS